jgi:hypothetical protein
MSDSERFAIVGEDSFIHEVVIWNGINEWNPCHDSDKVILLGEESFGIGDKYENESFYRVATIVSQSE